MFSDGKLFIHRIKEDNMIECVDVTKQVANALAKYIVEE